MERNEYLEMDGLFWESETHEWFHDKISTNYAQQKGLHDDALPNICAFIVRNKDTGRYDRVLMDKSLGDHGEIIYETTSLEDIGFEIDKLKLHKRFK